MCVSVCVCVCVCKCVCVHLMKTAVPCTAPAMLACHILPELQTGRSSHWPNSSSLFQSKKKIIYNNKNNNNKTMNST